jgi:carbonic anhydrase
MKFSIIKFICVIILLVCVLSTETEVKSKTSSGSEIKSEMKTNNKNKSQTENKSQVQVKSESKVGNQIKAKVKTEAKSMTENKTKSKTESKTEAKVQSQSATQAMSHVQAKTEIKVGLQTKMNMKTQTQAQAKSTVSLTAQAKVNSKTNFNMAKNLKKHRSNNNNNNSNSNNSASVMSYLGSLYNADKTFNFQTPSPSGAQPISSGANPNPNPTPSGSIPTPIPSDSSPTPSTNVESPPQVDMLQDWLMISSHSFQNKVKFPPVTLPNGKSVTIKYDSDNFRINEAYSKIPDSSEKPPSDKFFWFRHVGSNIYYSSTDSDINILGVVSVKSITSVNIKQKGPLAQNTKCFEIEDFENCQWDLCANDTEVMNKWLCKLQTLLEQKLDPICNSNTDGNVNQPTVIEKKITQPIIIIPTPSPYCNENWNYQNRGSDWNCECSEGSEQSPIDLPIQKNAIDTVVRPLFQYEEVSSISQETTLDGMMKTSERLKMKLDQNILTIFHKNFGKLVTMDGAVYHAQEIRIHTPAEHKIGGNNYDMEIQIIHYGQSKGDIAKQAVLSFLFEKKPGAYNKFIDDLDFFNLPNPLNKEVEITNNINIAKIFYSADDTDLPVWKPFSFYTYQGSLTSPPCTERTIMYVASKPLPISTTALQLFQEALRVPDLINEKGDVMVSNWIPVNNRSTQPLHGRPVFHYDHEKNCGPDPVKAQPKPAGHFEKIEKAITNYFYVNDSEPSGIPGAFVVSEKEALGK